jgi:hypothetical protein
MLPGLLTPTHVLIIVAILAVTFGLRRVTTPGARSSRPARAPGLRLLRSLRLRRPTRGQAHVAWLLVSALVAFAFTRSVALPLFLLVFLALWICGYGVLSRLYR